MEQLSDFLLQVIEFVGVEELFDLQPQTVTYDFDCCGAGVFGFAIHDVSDRRSVEAAFSGKPGMGKMVLLA